MEELTKKQKENPLLDAELHPEKYCPICRKRIGVCNHTGEQRRAYIMAKPFFNKRNAGVKEEYQEVIMQDKKNATTFTLRYKYDGVISGLYARNIIWVHAVCGNGVLSKFMNVLIKKFKTNKIIFSPLINSNIKNKVKGVIKICKADDKSNPYGEDFEYMECNWKRNE